MSAYPNISLVIPAWNAENTIEDCLLSAIKAKLSPDEIIIVDDLSSDNTKKKTIIIKSKYSKIRLIKLKNRSGPAKARDVGAKKAKGDIIFFADSDVIFLKNTFQNALKTFNKFGADAVSGIYSHEPANEGKTQLYKALFFNYHFIRHKEPFEYETFNGQIAMIKKSVYISSGGYDTKIKWGLDNENEEFGRRINKKFKLYLDPNFQVKHNFPGFKKLTKTYFFRVSTYMYIFLKNLKFESKGGAAADVGIGTMSVFLFFLSIMLALTLSSIFFYFAIFFMLAWLMLLYKFFFFVYQLKGGFIFYAIVMNIWFSNVISLGALWGLIKWLSFKRN